MQYGHEPSRRKSRLHRAAERLTLTRARLGLRFSVGRKIIAGFTVPLVLGTVAMLVIYNGLHGVMSAMKEVLEVEEPISAAAYEMEINTIGAGMGVLNYLGTGDPQHRERFHKDVADFGRFKAQYDTLARDARDRALGAKVGALYAEYRDLGASLMEASDQRRGVFKDVAERLRAMDTRLEDRLRRTIDAGAVDALAKVRAVGRLEVEIAELGTWLGTYLHAPTAQHRAQIFDEVGDVRRAARLLGALHLTGSERSELNLLVHAFEAAVQQVEQLVALQEMSGAGITRFLELREALDHVLDDEIQAPTARDLVAAKGKAESATRAVLYQLGVLGPIFVLASLGAGALLIFGITGPVRRLRAGTAALGHGDLTYRVAAGGTDELAALAADFNRMAVELEATTVSRETLAASELKLQAAVARLQHEIAERRRIEEEQAGLQASLHRAEAMSAMGALVGGVAHSLRNPLFGISSVLDAMEARFTDRQEYAPYLTVLRAQMARLITLVQDLFEYAKPASRKFEVGKIDDVIGDAVQACGVLARQRNVELTTRVVPGAAAILMDRAKLARVFENLIENAIQHSPTGATVVVEAREMGGADKPGLECCVLDSGPGIAAEDLPRISAPFFTRRPGGTGLGLAIAERVVEEHHGIMSAANRPEGGTVISVRLPLGRT